MRERASFPAPDDGEGWEKRRRADLRKRGLPDQYPVGAAAEIMHAHAMPAVQVPPVLSRRQYLDLIEGGD